MTISHSNTVAKFDMRLNPVYQVDFSAASSGKRVSVTKRRVRWRFGFSSAAAIGEGFTGTGCRGEEHEINLVWSLASGKRLIVADGIEVHFSQGRRTETKFEASWTMKGNHILKVVAHAATPVFSGNPQFRQFDLFLDGLSFFDFPRVYELGSAPSRSFAMTRNEGWDSTVERYENQHSMDRGPSLQEGPAFARSSYASDTSFPSDLVSDPTPVNYVQDHFSSPVAMIDQARDTRSRSMEELSQGSPTAVDEFKPQPPTYKMISSEIMNAYGPPSLPSTPALPALTYEPAQPQAQTPAYEPAQPQVQAPAYAPPAPPISATEVVVFETPQQPQAPSQFTYSYEQQSPAMSELANIPDSPVQQAPPQPPQSQELTMNSSLTLANPDEEEPKNDFDRAMQSLVNLDDITDDPISPESLKLTMIREEEEQRKSNKSRGLPPAAPAWHLGSQASLADIQAHAEPRAPSKDIMRTHAFDPSAVQSGAMVVYGSQPQPSPHGSMHLSSFQPGFGAGAHHQAGYAPTPYYGQAAY